MSKKYVIIDADEVSSVDFAQVMETSADTLRYNLAGTQTFVKYVGNKPRFLSGKDTATHSEILETLSGPEWAAPDGPL